MLSWLVMTPLAIAYDDVPKELREWIGLISGGARELLKLEPFHAEFARAGVGVPALADIEMMRRAATGHPDHPDAGRLHTIELRLAHQDVSHVRLWAGRSLWRLATSYGDEADQFFDLGGTAESVWNLLPDGMNVSSRISPGQNDYSIVAMRLIDDFAYLTSGGMHQVSKSANPWQYNLIEFQGTHWTARADDPKGGPGHIAAEGTWDQHGIVRRVERVTGVYTLGDSTRTYTFTSSGWKRLDFPPYAIASVVNLPNLETGAPDAVTTLISIDPIRPDQLRTLAAVPGGQSPDPIRGSLVGRRKIDNRNGTQSILTEKGDQQTYPVPGGSPSGRRFGAREAGWVAGGSVVAVVFLLKLRSMRRA